MSLIDVYTDFVFLEHEPEKADIIFIPGSDQGALAVRAAELWRAGFAPIVLPSGKYGKLTEGFTGDAAYQTEWEYLRALLLAEGVPEAAVWREDQASFTYENALYSRKVTDAAGLEVRTALLCCQAYHARRASLYYQVCFPEARILVCPAVTRGISRDNWYQSKEGTELVLGEVERCGTQFHEIFAQYRA